ncbi:MAG TPA: TfoX/Sxy family protein [Rhizomicrobium sp.]|jgi:DNA transformation protein|nr:TfoX/Sxy family protein [Rhizomicrobium sp.]
MTPEFHVFITELFLAFGPVEGRRVFNFDGLYIEGTMFGLVANGRVFLKTDTESRKAFAAEDCGPLLYRARDGADVEMSYYEMPSRLYDEPEEASAWARRAYDVALKSPTALRKQRRRVKEKHTRQPARSRSRS